MLTPDFIPEFWPWFTTIIFIIATTRLIELTISLNNENQMKKRGGVERHEVQFILMKILHFSWFTSCFLESLYMGKLAHPFLIGLGLVGLAYGAIVRFKTMKALGDRWSAKIFVIPGENVVRKGPYKNSRHPNYLGVVIEFVSLPLIFSCYKTLIIYSLLNFLLLFWRIRAEENALMAESDYMSAFLGVPRFFPKSGSHKNSSKESYEPQ